MTNPESKPAISGEGLKKAAINLADQFIPRRASEIDTALIGFADACTITFLLSSLYFIPLGLMISLSSRLVARRTSKEE